MLPLQGFMVVRKLSAWFRLDRLFALFPKAAGCGAPDTGGVVSIAYNTCHSISAGTDDLPNMEPAIWAD